MLADGEIEVVGERCVCAPVNGQRNDTGRDRRDECLNSVLVMKIQ